MNRFALPIAVFVVMVGFLAAGLTRDPGLVPSPLIDKPAPEFSLPRLRDPGTQLKLDDLRGSVSLLNVWATWCISCRVEHDMLLEIAATGVVPIYGLNYKDNREDALRWLQQLGDPYRYNGFDESGAVGLDFGVYGAPETYVIGTDATIEYKHIGPITPEVWKAVILPLVLNLKGDTG